MVRLNFLFLISINVASSEIMNILHNFCFEKFIIWHMGSFRSTSWELSIMGYFSSVSSFREVVLGNLSLIRSNNCIDIARYTQSVVLYFVK